MTNSIIAGNQGRLIKKIIRMKKIKILTVVGARPQFIKAAAISNEIKKRDNVDEIIIHTGQHFDENMSQVFFEEMKIPKPIYQLNHGSLNHGAMTGRMIEEIESIVLKEKPNWVLVYGDTNSTLAGAIVTSKLNIKLAHVEAGLRSFNMDMPEEVNRILTDRVSNVLFCTSQKAINNLNKEGYNSFDNEILDVGDVMYDTALLYSKKAKKPNYNLPQKYALATIHRPVNTDSKNNLTKILNAFNKINEELPVILLVHPRTKNYITKYNLNPKFLMLDPVGFLEMIYLLKNSEIVFTDSGGLQKETFFHKKPCVTLRDETEWTELLEIEANVLCKIEENLILDAFKKMLNKKEINFELKPYGDGFASKKIVDYLVKNKS